MAVVVVAVAGIGVLVDVIGGSAASAAPTTYYAAPAAAGAGNCTSPANACLVADAIDPASDGDTVELADGTYNVQAADALSAPLSVSTSITIHAAAGAHPVLDAHGTGKFGLITADATAHIVIDGLTLQGAASGVFTRGTFGASAIVRHSTIINNGFGIQAWTRLVTVEDSTIANNTNTGLVVRSGMRVTGSTIAHNGTGIDAPNSGSILISASIVAGNTTDCLGSVDDYGFNIDGDATCGFGATGSVSGSSTIAGKLAALADNGGPTPTMALLAGSPAIGLVTGPPSTRLSAVCGTADQRGVLRPAAACDAGAFQTQPATPAAPTFTDDVCAGSTPTGASYTIPSTVGVDYLVGGNPTTAGTHPATDGTTITVTAQTQAGYVLTGTSSWSHTFPATPHCTLPQTITFTSTPPASPVVGDTYTVQATGGGSGKPVGFSTGSPAVCTVSGSVVHFVAVGSCVVNANQAGNADYYPAAQVSQTIQVAAAPVSSSSARPSQSTGSSQPATGSSTSGAGLASTGTPTAGLILVALLFVAGGGGLLLVFRRRPVARHVSGRADRGR